MRWGFLGASRIGRRALAPAIHDCGHLLNAVAARDFGRAREFADAFGATRAYGSYGELLDDPGIDAVYVGLTNESHLPWTLRALQAGKHVLCEKPLALDAGEVARMQAAEAASGRRVMEAFCHLHHPQIARVQALLADGAIGDLVMVQAVFGNTLENAEDFRWRAAHGGGALLDLGGYCVSLMRVLAGEARSVSAIATMHGDVDATFSGQLDFGGATGQFMCSFRSARSQHVELIGTRGTLLLDWPFSTNGRETGLFLNDRAERLPATNPYARMVRYFARMATDEPGLPFGLDWSLMQARTLDMLRAAV